MDSQLVVTLVLGIGQIIFVVVLAPAVKALVALGGRVSILEEARQRSEKDDSNTANELHEVRNSMGTLQVTVAKLEGGMNTIASVIGAKLEHS